jgi:hypothetical protein
LSGCSALDRRHGRGEGDEIDASEREAGLGLPGLDREACRGCQGEKGKKRAAHASSHCVDRGYC